MRLRVSLLMVFLFACETHSMEGLDVGVPLDAPRLDASRDVPFEDASLLDAHDTHDHDGGFDVGPEIEDAGRVHDARTQPERVPVFVAQGYVGRTTISCDDGRSWIADQSMDESVRCNRVDCDHHPGRGMGILFSGEHFIATYGWGGNGSVKRSADALTWETTMMGPTFGGVTTGNDLVLLGSSVPRMSDDEGESWQSAGTPMLAAWNVRRTGFAGDRFLLVAEDSRESDLGISDGSGRWWNASVFPPECGQAIQNDGGIGQAGEAMVIIGGDGIVCRSTDGGATWASTSLGTSIPSRTIEVGDELWVWGRGRLFKTTDGMRFTETPTVPNDIVIGAVARSPEGTFVAVQGGWDQWYERQRFYRSEDGVRWAELSAANYHRGHPIHAIAHGEVDAATCAR